MIEILEFLPVAPDSSLIYEGSYSPTWVIISVLLAILASYAALSASKRIGQAHNTTSRLTWALISAFTMGTGIWAMHFIGMLALSLPCGIRYDPFITLISMVPSILASGAALGIAWHGEKRLPLWVRSVLLGAGIGTMHYTGMAAMRLDGFVRYDPSLFVLSIFVAVALSYFALRVKSAVVRSNNRHDALIAVIMGSAVSGMHYTGMTAAYFVRGDVATLPASAFTTTTLAVTVALTTVFLALGALSLATISRNREITDQLRDSEERWKIALEGSGDGVWDWNPQTDEAVFSRRWKEMLGYTEVEFPDTGTAGLEHIHPDDKSRVQTAIQECFAGSPFYAAEFRMHCKDGSWKWIFARGKLVSRDANGNPSRMICTHTDITERKQAEDRINELAFFDQLTGLPNRTLLLDRLKQAMIASSRSGSYGALLFLDLDNFKTLNDTLGHNVGDQLLKQVAQRLTTCVREGDTVARLGGDEFVLVLGGLSTVESEAAIGAEMIAEKALSTFNQPYQLDNVAHHSTVSIGVTLFRGRHVSIDDLLKQADLAMYKSKEAGRNAFHFYDPDMETTVKNRS